jgi:hypothetical protein
MANLRCVAPLLLLTLLLSTARDCGAKRRKPGAATAAAADATAAAPLPHLPTPTDASGAAGLVTQQLAAGERGAERDPRRQLRLYRAVAERVRPLAEHEPMLEILDAMAKLARRVKQHGVSLQCHQEMLSLRGQAGAIPESYLVLWTEMATDLHLDGKYAEALRVLDQADDQLRDQLTDEGLSLMHKQRAFLHECDGKYAEAVGEMERARGLAAPEAADLRAHLDEVLRHRTMLTRMAAAGGMEGRDATAELAAVRSQIDEMGAYLVERGPWATPLQLPHKYIPSITARPWHDASGADIPQLQPLLAVLREAAPALKKEYRKLKKKRLLLADEDCIQRDQGGKWHVRTHTPPADARRLNGVVEQQFCQTACLCPQRYEIAAVWQRLNGTACSMDSPVACSVLADLRATAAAPILRAGYSAVDAHTWIRPHFGSTNAALKIHLGLRVDTSDCAKMRVGEEWRGWVEGDTILFDDRCAFSHLLGQCGFGPLLVTSAGRFGLIRGSMCTSFEHEVENKCDGERVVFQVVVRHPELDWEDAKTYTPVIVDAH